MIQNPEPSASISGSKSWSIWLASAICTPCLRPSRMSTMTCSRTLRAALVRWNSSNTRRFGVSRRRVMRRSWWSL